MTIAIKRSRIFYGWYIVIASVVVMTLGIGGAGYVFGVFFPALVGEFGWSRAELSGANSLSFVVMALLGPMVGRLTDRYGPKAVMAIGGVVCGIGFASLSLVGSLGPFNDLLAPITQFYIFFLIFAIGLAGAGFVPINTVVANWFMRRRGLALGLTATGIGWGGFVMIPVAGYLIDNFGWRIAYAVLGALILASVLPVALFIMRLRPQEMGLLPDGDVPESVGSPLVAEADASDDDGSGPSPASSMIGGLTVRQAMGTLSFWSLGLAYACYGLGLGTVLVHAITMFTDRGFASQDARLIISFVALLGIVGKVVVGYLADRVSVKMLGAVCFAIQAAGTVILINANSLALAWAFVLIWGFSMGGIVALQPVLVGRYFGLASFGAIFGALGLFMGTSAASPIISGYIFDVSGSYIPAFTAFAVADALGALFILALRVPRQVLEPKPALQHSTVLREDS
jgi:MFS family permease